MSEKEIKANLQEHLALPEDEEPLGYRTTRIQNRTTERSFRELSPLYMLKSLTKRGSKASVRQMLKRDPKKRALQCRLARLTSRRISHSYLEDENPSEGRQSERVKAYLQNVLNVYCSCKSKSRVDQSYETG